MRMHKRARLIRCHIEELAYDELHVPRGWVFEDDCDRRAIGPVSRAGVEYLHQLRAGNVGSDVPGVCDERQLFGMRLTGREHKPQHDEKSPMSHNCPLSINLR